MKYVRLCKSVADKGILIPESEVMNKVDLKNDWYVSSFYYNQEHFDQFKVTGSIRGIDDVVTDKLYFDFDDKNDPNNAINDARTVVSRLNLSGDPEIYFSGYKGVHVIAQTNQTMNPTQVAMLAQKYGAGLKTMDHSVYNASRILRVPGTKHQISKLYKFPLTKVQLNDSNFNDIKKLASSLDNTLPEYNWTIMSVKPEEIVIPVQEKVKNITNNSVSDIKDLKPPYGWKLYKWAIAEGFFNASERHEALMVLAATCRGLGYDKTTAYHICKSAIEKQANRSGQEKFDKEELYQNILDKSVYSDGWEGGAYSPKTHPWLSAYCERLGIETGKDDEPTRIIGLDQIEEEFTHFVKHIGENTILTGIPRLDKIMPLTIGMNLGIVGAASSGKTAIALDILKNTSKAGVISVFASLDMHRNRLFEKLLYKVTGLSREALYREFSEDRGNAIVKEIKKDYGNVFFYDRSCPTVSDIRAYITEVEKQTGKKVKLVMLDYFERVGASRSDDTAASKEVSGQLQDLVNDFNVCLITLVQPNKFSLGGGPDNPLIAV